MGGFDDYTLAGGPTVGPTGAVSWATHGPSGRAVGVTLLADDAASDGAFLGRLRATVAALSTLHHPNVLPVREVVEGRGRVWVVEDWVDGRALGDILTDGPLTPEQSAALACGVLRGLVAVEALGVVHGELSPATIVVGAGGVPLLVGFGFAGLPGRAPAPAPTDPRGDVSTVVTVLRDLLAGATSTTTHRKLDKALERATSVDASHRPAGAAELLAILEKAARSDFGKGWETRTSLAPLAVAKPVAASVDETQVLPADVTQGQVSDVEAAAPGPVGDPTVPDAIEAAAPDTVVAAPTQETIEAPAPAPAVASHDAEPDLTPAPTQETTAAPREPDPPEPAQQEPDPPAPAPAVAMPEPAGAPPDPEGARPAQGVRAPAAVTVSATAEATPPPTVGAAPASSTWGDRAPVAERPAEAQGRPSRRRRQPPPPGLVRNLAGVILILLGAGTATAVERISSDRTRSSAESVSTASSAVPTPAEIASSDVNGTWAMKLTVVESTGFFGTRVGNSVDKTYTLASDCSPAPCVQTLVVSGQTGEFVLGRDAEGYVLNESGPNDCVDLPTGAVRVPNGGVATVQAHLNPSGATRTPRGTWAATGLTGSIVTTFDTSHPDCVQGSGLQRSTVVGTRR